jgi:hypothetical protein
MFYTIDPIIKQKITSLGNHDVTFHDDYYAKNWQRYHKSEYDVKEIQACLKDLKEITYLEVSKEETKKFTGTSDLIELFRGL